jgi:hypothetical protein
VRETLQSTDRAYIIHQGRILREGTAAQLVEDPKRWRGLPRPQLRHAAPPRRHRRGRARPGRAVRTNAPRRPEGAEPRGEERGGETSGSSSPCESKPRRPIPFLLREAPRPPVSAVRFPSSPVGL